MAMRRNGWHDLRPLDKGRRHSFWYQSISHNYTTSYRLLVVTFARYRLATIHSEFGVFLICHEIACTGNTILQIFWLSSTVLKRVTDQRFSGNDLSFKVWGRCPSSPPSLPLICHDIFTGTWSSNLHIKWHCDRKWEAANKNWKRFRKLMRSFQDCLVDNIIINSLFLARKSGYHIQSLSQNFSDREPIVGCAEYGLTVYIERPKMLSHRRLFVALSTIIAECRPIWRRTVMANDRE